MNSIAVKSRFAPSPTGRIHLGNCRTALFNHLFAANQNGSFLLRIEDTDVARSTKEHAHALMEDFRWLDLLWQEGAEVGGELGPYWQSERSAIYQTYYDRLIESNRAYPCFCTEAELAIRRKLQLSAGKPPRYAGTCRQLSAAQIAEKKQSGLKPALRFRMQDDEVIEFTDLVKGSQRYLASEIGDFIIRRADGGASFMFCNAIDDSLMCVTHAIRGEDHLTNTPRQIAILNALKMPVPIYGHISLILGQDGAPLSKRNGSLSVQELREQGYLPIAVLNYLARLGHYYEATELMTHAQLAAHFATEHLSHSPARFDPQQLLHWQKSAMQQLDLHALKDLLPAEVCAQVPVAKLDAFIQLVKPNLVFPVEAKHWAELLLADHLNYGAESLAVLQATPAVVFDAALAALDQHGQNFAALADHVKQTANVKGKALFQPLRVALTGELHGPEMAGVAEFLGVDMMRQRFSAARDQANKNER